MKITAVRAKVYEWKGEVDKPRPHFSGSAMDILYAKAETMATFRFHGWLVVEVETSALKFLDTFSKKRDSDTGITERLTRPVR